MAALCPSRRRRGPLPSNDSADPRRGELEDGADHSRRAHWRARRQCSVPPIPVAPQGVADGALVVGTPKNSAAIRGLGWQTDLAKAGPEGYLIRAATDRRIVPSSPLPPTARSARCTARSTSCACCRPGSRSIELNVTERPKVQLRMLNHWDNLDGSIERGYAGRSLWQWNELPGTLEPALRRLRARQRVDRHQRRGRQQRQRRRRAILTPEYLAKVAALADVLAPVRRARCTCRPTSPRRCGSAA